MGSLSLSDNLMFLGDFEKGGNLTSLSRCEEASDYPDEIQVATQVLTSLDNFFSGQKLQSFFWHFQLGYFTHPNVGLW